MIVRARGKFLSQSFILLCLSQAILLPRVQQQAIASMAGQTKADVKPGLSVRTEPAEYSIFDQLFPESIDHNIRLVIKLSDRRVYVYRDNHLRVSYPIAVGKAGWETPKGNYRVIQMQRNPAWQHPWTGKIIPPGPDNPLGARWIAFWTDGRNFIGFHGTPDEKLVGQAVSHGCIRMRNQDILALYGQVNVGTAVTVVP